MKRHYRWKALEGAGLEHLTLETNALGARAKGVVMGERGGQPYAFFYQVQVDERWRTRRVDIQSLDEGPSLSIEADGEGHWYQREGGAPLPLLTGCIDVDFAATPFTNALPLRRYPWQPGEVREFSMAYIAVPDLQLSAAPQRYRCLAPAQRFLYDALFRDFQAELDVDDDGIVVSYPGLFQRLA